MLFEQQQFTYDNNGNQLQTILTTYTDGIPGTPVVTQQNTYDLRKQLTRTVTENGTIVENVYNGDGLRVEKIVGSTSTRYLYEYQRVVLEQNSLGNVTGGNVYGTNLLMRTVGVDAFFYMYNAHADVTALLSTSGTIIATYYYDAFGNILEQTGSASNSILFAGYQYDAETGMYYLNARMYDPVTARFMQEDTYTGQNNDPLSLNLYTYCHNEPLMYSDPTGHKYAGMTGGSSGMPLDVQVIINARGEVPKKTTRGSVTNKPKTTTTKSKTLATPAKESEWGSDSVFNEEYMNRSYNNLWCTGERDGLIKVLEPFENSEDEANKLGLTNDELRPDSDSDGIPNYLDDSQYGEGLPYIDDFDYDGVANGLDATPRLKNEEIISTSTSQTPAKSQAEAYLSPGNIGSVISSEWYIFGEANYYYQVKAILASVKPNNYTPDYWNTGIQTRLGYQAWSKNLNSGFSKGIGALAITVDVGAGIYENVQKGTSTERIISDAAVDLSFDVASLCASSAAGSMAVGALAGSVVPVVGTIIGAAVGLTVGVGISLAIDTKIYGKSIKDRVKDGVYNSLKTIDKGIYAADLAIWNWLGLESMAEGGGGGGHF